MTTDHMNGRPDAGKMTPYVFEGRTFTVVEINGEPWFVATDISDELGHRDAYSLTRSLDDDEKGTHTTCTPGGEQVVNVISEPGLYRAIVQRRAQRKQDDTLLARIGRFQRWVFHDVLPSIRKTGSYSLVAAPVPDLEDPEVLQGLLLRNISKRLEAEKRADVAEEKVHADKPKTTFYDNFANSDGVFGLQVTGKMLKEGPNKFIRGLKQEYLFYRNGSLVPRERFTRSGIFEVKPYIDDTGTARYQTFVTPKGVQYFAKKFGGLTEGVNA